MKPSWRGDRPGSAAVWPHLALAFFAREGRRRDEKALISANSAHQVATDCDQFKAGSRLTKQCLGANARPLPTRCSVPWPPSFPWARRPCAAARAPRSGASGQAARRCVKPCRSRCATFWRVRLGSGARERAHAACGARKPLSPNATRRRVASQAAPQLAAKAPAGLRSAGVRTRIAASRPGQARSPTLATRCIRPRRSDARCAAGSQVVATFTVPAPASVPPTPAAPQLPPTLAPGKVFEVRAGCCAPLAAGALPLCAVRALARALFILTRRGATWACLAPRRPL